MVIKPETLDMWVAGCRLAPGEGLEPSTFGLTDRNHPLSARPRKPCGIRVSLVFVAGYTAVGFEAATALAVLPVRLVRFSLPILPGWLALVGLQRSGRM